MSNRCAGFAPTCSKVDNSQVTGQQVQQVMKLVFLLGLGAIYA